MNLYVGPGWCGEREHHPPHDTCRGYGAGYRAAEVADGLPNVPMTPTDPALRAHTAQHIVECRQCSFEGAAAEAAPLDVAVDVVVYHEADDGHEHYYECVQCGIDLPAALAVTSREEEG